MSAESLAADASGQVAGTDVQIAGTVAGIQAQYVNVSPDKLQDFASVFPE